MNKMISYIKTAIYDFKNVASPFASSTYAARKVVAQLKSEYTFVLEIGPGNGAITKEILKFLPTDGKLLVLEINEDFIKELRTIKDERLIIVQGDVREMAKLLNFYDLKQFDAVVSGIPFSFFKKKVRREILDNTINYLRPGGVYVVYQITPFLLPMIKKVFGNKVKIKMEFRNFAPYYIMIAETQSAEM